MKKIEGLRREFLTRSIAFGVRGKAYLKSVIRDQRGNDTINNIIISAIILLALVLLNTPIRTWITSVWSLISGFITDKLETLFNS